MTMLLALVAAITAQAAQTPPPPADTAAATQDTDDIVVTARMRDRARDTARRVEAALPPTTIEQPLARFTDPICPGVVGMARASGQAVVDRIGIVADMLGLKVGAPGCDPNLLVIATADGRALVRRMMARRPANIQAQTLADLRRILAEPGGARAWVEWEVRNRDGQRAMPQNDGPPTLAVQGSSRIVSAIRRDIVSAIVVIDTAALAGHDPVQIADYAAMRALADARPARIGDTASILTAFTPAAAAPATLTPFDLGLLRGLYKGQGNVTAGMKRAMMVREIVAAPPEG
ncbi:hypothetical protein QLH51_08105 [Sphingomonas sp. 2R-10]|uniref:hypothetical protein n=1 Tax=Sphingomonas sp. 2R-10 TaxID=3045148 RepID=UPI0024BACC51|nr:hypothetical protein [Sphingomonas sp. 2R-10]MDJ0276755.1 hypothetical protein [Sphingomonas sp. 2R-10]